MKHQITKTRARELAEVSIVYRLEQVRSWLTTAPSRTSKQIIKAVRYRDVLTDELDRRREVAKNNLSKGFTR